VSQLLSAIETIGESRGVKHAVVNIRVDTDRGVDDLYAELGTPDHGRCEAPFDDVVLDGTAYERRAMTTVLGVTVTIVGPFQLVRRVA
jgi:hypothetical protein